jgi:hypothetical protein
MAVDTARLLRDVACVIDHGKFRRQVTLRANVIRGGAGNEFRRVRIMAVRAGNACLIHATLQK